jgi:hypothetical protein
MVGSLAIVLAALRGNAANAASPNACTLGIAAGWQWSSVENFYSPGAYGFRVSWNTIASCGGGGALDGLPVVLVVDVATDTRGGGNLGGSATVSATAGNSQLDVSGNVHGSVACSDSTCSADIEVRASGQHYRLVIPMVVDFDRATGEILGFKPADADIATTGQ